MKYQITSIPAMKVYPGRRGRQDRHRRQAEARPRGRPRGRPGVATTARQDRRPAHRPWAGFSAFDASAVILGPSHSSAERDTDRMTDARATTSTRGTTRYADRTAGPRPPPRSAPCSPSPPAPRSSRSPAACRSSRRLPRELVAGAMDRVMRDSGARRPCSTAPARACPRLREHILEVMALEGIRGSVDDVVVDHRLAARARPRHEALHRPGRRRPRRGPELRRRARRLQVVPGRGRCTCRWTPTAWCRRRCASHDRAS